MDNTFKLHELLLGTLSVFRHVKDTPVLSAFAAFIKAMGEGDSLAACQQYAEVYHQLRATGFSGLGAYLNEQLQYTETLFARMLVRQTADPGYLAAAERDHAILNSAANMSCADMKRCLSGASDGEFDDIIEELPEWETGGLVSFEELQELYRQNGWGVLARYRAFVWTGDTLKPVLSPDPVRFDEMVGYDWQRQAVLSNTRALVAGRAVNNVLLYGDSGTGKSATVKSMLNMDGFESLTVIEIKKQSLAGLQDLMDMLAAQPKKFIIFIDDLSFETGDPDYSALKVMLEGSLGRRPQNVALYVTSNRRQLVKRHFSDRDEMNGAETVQEKTSLADRFGIRLPFFELNQEDYLFTVAALVRQAGIEAEPEALKRAALQWEIEHGGRSPRTARQFADELAAKKGIE
jgi:predicted AAA+ superfamily ATPase